MKYLVLILVILVVVLLAKGARGRVGSRPAADPVPPRPAADPALGDGEVMLACTHCGLHLPRSEALPGRGGVFCSEAHRAIVEARDGAG